VVSQVAIGQDMIVGTKARGFTVTRGTVNGDVLAKGVKVANFSPSYASFPFEVLRLETNAGEWEDFVPDAQAGFAIQDHMRVQSATGAQHHARTNHTVRPNFALRADLRAGMDDGCRMYFRCGGAHPSTNMNATSASLTISPLTEQTPRA